MVEYSAGVRLHGVYPLGNRDRVIRLFEGNFLDSLSEAAQESPTSRRLPWRRTPIGVASRPGRSRTFAARLSAEYSPVELQAVCHRSSRWLAPGELNPSSLAY